VLFPVLVCFFGKFIELFGNRLHKFVRKLNLIGAFVCEGGKAQVLRTSQQVSGFFIAASLQLLAGHCRQCGYGLGVRELQGGVAALEDFDSAHMFVSPPQVTALIMGRMMLGDLLCYLFNCFFCGFLGGFLGRRHDGVLSYGRAWSLWASSSSRMFCP